MFITDVTRPKSDAAIGVTVLQHDLLAGQTTRCEHSSSTFSLVGLRRHVRIERGTECPLHYSEWRTASREDLCVHCALFVSIQARCIHNAHTMPGEQRLSMWLTLFLSLASFPASLQDDILGRREHGLFPFDMKIDRSQLVVLFTWCFIILSTRSVYFQS